MPNSDKAVGHGNDVGVHLYSVAAAVTGFAQTAGGPAEPLLNSLSDPVSDGITQMPCAYRHPARGTFLSDGGLQVNWPDRPCLMVGSLRPCE